MDFEYKQVILIRKDLKLPKGKAAAQAAHAAVDAVLKSDKRIVSRWRQEGMRKICLSVSDVKELYSLVQDAKDLGLTTATITDAGRTVVEPGTVTCAAIGPDIEEKIDPVTGNLKMY
ncbi:MAG: peptidyl-tRNA hydrolase Pth2 [Candidatus Woesearchaeota archaeon]